ncbi:MAG TPA: HNH endonuclease [Planctomycetota bacterium]|nr:HNH endonuclease [Planctomycetota bacterium]
MSSVSALDSSVLVLNRNYMAVHVTTVKRAFCLLFKEAAEVISFNDDNTMNAYDIRSWVELTALRRNFAQHEDGEYVHTVSLEIRVPKIIRLLFYDRLPRKQVKFNRRNIFARDGNRCQYCGRRRPTPELSLDHIIPRSRGGQATWANIICCCTECNVRKGGRTPKEAGMRLIRHPYKPRRSPLIRVRIQSDKYKSWRHFVDDAYWSVTLTD